jgi:hypothetical protein
VELGSWLVEGSARHLLLMKPQPYEKDNYWKRIGYVEIQKDGNIRSFTTQWYVIKKLKNSVAFVRKRTIPTERPPLSAK